MGQGYGTSKLILVFVLHDQCLALGKPFSISELWSSHLECEPVFFG